MAHCHLPWAPRSSSYGWLLVAVCSPSTQVLHRTCTSDTSSKIWCQWKERHLLFASEESKDNSFPYRGSHSSAQELDMIRGCMSLGACLHLKRPAKQAGDLQAVAAVLQRALQWSSSRTCCSSRNFGLWGSEKAWKGNRNLNYWGASVVTQKICVAALLHKLKKNCLLAVLYVLHELLCGTTYQPAEPPFYPCLVTAAAPAILCQALPHGFFHKGCFALLRFALRRSWSVCSSPLVLHQLFCTTIYPRQQSHTLLVLFWLLVSCLRLCWFSRNPEERGILFLFPKLWSLRCCAEHFESIA